MLCVLPSVSLPFPLVCVQYQSFVLRDAGNGYVWLVEQGSGLQRCAQHAAWAGLCRAWRCACEEQGSGLQRPSGAGLCAALGALRAMHRWGQSAVVQAVQAATVGMLWRLVRWPAPAQQRRVVQVRDSLHMDGSTLQLAPAADGEDRQLWSVDDMGDG